MISEHFAEAWIDIEATGGHVFGKVRVRYDTTGREEEVGEPVPIGDEPELGKGEWWCPLLEQTVNGRVTNGRRSVEPPGAIATDWNLTRLSHFCAVEPAEAFERIEDFLDDLIRRSSGLRSPRRLKRGDPIEYRPSPQDTAMATGAQFELGYGRKVPEESQPTFLAGMRAGLTLARACLGNHAETMATLAQFMDRPKTGSRKRGTDRPILEQRILAWRNDGNQGATSGQFKLAVEANQVPGVKFSESVGYYANESEGGWAFGTIVRKWRRDLQPRSSSISGE